MHNDSRPALSRKNALFAGHDAGAENWAIIASLIETCKLNSVDPLAYLTATLKAIVNGHKQSYRLSVTMGLYRKGRTRSRREPLGLHSP